MMSIEQLSLMIKRHLGFHTYDERYSLKWTIFDSPLGGRGLMATEDIKIGEVLFVDHPLVYGPRSGTIIRRGCTACGRIDSESSYKCSLCALLLCSEQCQNSDLHSSDCGIISCWPNKVPIEDVDDTQLSRALTAIRALLLNEEQKNLLSSLQSHISPTHGTEIRNLMEYFDIPPQIEQLLTFVTCVLDANAFQIATPYGKKETSLRGLYPVSALMNHNCISNIRYSFNASSQMTVKAAKPIRAGTEIFTCYSGMLWGTPARRLHLYKTKHFLCTCDRCADPTERGTLLAALKCFSVECPGSLLPIEPLKTNTAWGCVECSLRVPNSNICAIQSALGSLIGTLDFQNISALEKYLSERITIYIPKTNQIVIDLQCRLIWAFGETEGLRWNGSPNNVLLTSRHHRYINTKRFVLALLCRSHDKDRFRHAKQLSESRLALKEKLCRGTLHTLAALGAGDAHLRGLLLYHLHAALAERARRSPDLYEELKSEIETTIEQAFNILQGDLSAPPDLELRRQYLGPGCDKPHEERFFILDNSDSYYNYN